MYLLFYLFYVLFQGQGSASNPIQEPVKDSGRAKLPVQNAVSAALEASLLDVEVPPVLPSAPPLSSVSSSGDESYSSPYNIAVSCPGFGFHGAVGDPRLPGPVNSFYLSV